MPFTKFTGRHRPSSPEPLMTIQRRGTMSLNKRAMDMLGHPREIELYYDTETQRMAIAPVTEHSAHSYPLRKQNTSDSYLFSGAAFCQFYRIDYGETRRYAGAMEDGMLVVDLGEPDNLVPMRRGRTDGHNATAS